MDCAGPARLKIANESRPRPRRAEHDWDRVTCIQIFPITPNFPNPSYCAQPELKYVSAFATAAKSQR